MTAVRRILLALTTAVVAGVFAVPAVATPAAAATSSVAAWRASAAVNYANQIVRYTNSYRASRGCPAVRPVSSLNLAAARHAADMATKRYFSHVGKTTGTFVQRAQRAGYRYPASENIAYGLNDGRWAAVAWTRSPGHRANMLNCRVRSVGAGVAFNSAGLPYYVQVFGWI